MLSNDVIKFAENNTDFYVGMTDYYASANRSHDDESALNKAFFEEIESKSGVERSARGWAQHPAVKWAFMSVTDAVLTNIVPQTVTPALEMFMELRLTQPGEIIKYTVEPNSLYTVSNSARGERTVNRVREFTSEMSLAPYAHQITVYENYYNIMTGKTSYVKTVVKAADSIKNEMYKDALNALTAGLTKFVNEPYRFEGAFDSKTLVEMCERVSVFNGGAKPIIAGSRVALMNVLPDSASGYRMNVDGKATSVSVTENFYGFEAVMLDQAAAGKDGLLLPDNKLFVICPSQDKLIKGVVGDFMSNSNEPLDNADLTKSFTLNKDWNFEYLSASKAGIYQIS